MKRIDFILDPISDRYRECLCCGEPFMALHRSRKFCDNDNWCHDEYNNRLKREKKKSEEIISEYKIPQSKEMVGELDRNLSILNSFNIGPDGYEIGLKVLTDLGFDFNKFTKKNKVELEGVQNLYSIDFGKYTLFRENESTLTIYKNEYNDRIRNNSVNGTTNKEVG